MPPSTDTIGSSTQVDVRGPRFSAWVTTAVLVITLIVSAFSALAAAVILGAQAVVFAIGALARTPSAPLRRGVRQPRGAPAAAGHRNENRCRR